MGGGIQTQRRGEVKLKTSVPWMCKAATQALYLRTDAQRLVSKVSKDKDPMRGEDRLYL